MRIYDVLVQFFAIVLLLFCVGLIAFGEEEQTQQLSKWEAEMEFYGIPEYFWIQVDTWMTDDATGRTMLDPKVVLTSRYAYVYEYGELTLNDLLQYKRRGVIHRVKSFTRYTL
jgi:hypothetical protein